MRLRLLEAWNGYDRGEVVNLGEHPGLAEDMVKMRIAEPADVVAERPQLKQQVKGRTGGSRAIHS